MFKKKYSPELQILLSEPDGSIDERASDVISMKEASMNQYDERIKDISKNISSSKAAPVKKKSPNIGNSISELIKLMSENK